MSNTPTKKDEKEIASEVKAMETVLNSLSYTQLSELLKEKKDKEIEAVTHKLKEARGIVEALEAQLVNLGVTSAAPVAPKTAKRGRKPRNIGPIGTVSDIKATGARKAPKKAKGKRGAVGAAILSFLASKGKAGAKIAEIAAATGNKPANVTAFFYAGAGKKAAKRVAPATFALKK
jgi:hypothetical protein